VGPSDSEKDCSSSRRDSDTPQVPHAPRLEFIAPSGDSESGGSHSPSPRASRRRQVDTTNVTPLETIFIDSSGFFESI